METRERLALLRRLMPAPLRRYISRLDVEVLTMFGAAFVVVIAALAFLAITGEVLEGDTQQVDESIVRWFRQPGDPSLPRGPQWQREAAIDITALGSWSVLLLLVLGVSGFLWIERQWRLIGLLLASTVGGWVMNYVMKGLFERPRPSVVPHLREVTTTSFPSGHATSAAIVFLTIGVLLFDVVKRPRARLYCIAVAMLAAGLVGFTRVYLGVHYPSDVLAGWATGIAWAMACWVASQYLLVRQRKRD